MEFCLVRDRVRSDKNHARAQCPEDSAPQGRDQQEEYRQPLWEVVVALLAASLV